MATMYPRTLPTDAELKQAGLDEISSAERKLFDLFRDHLDDDHNVFLGRRFQAARGRGGGIEDLEVDFVILHPSHGALTLEAKGGLIRIDGVTGEWTSRDRFGDVHDIKNPLEQARKGCYELFKKLRENPALTQYDYSTWYGIALPDVDVLENLDPATPRAIVLDRRDAHPDRIAAAVERMFSHYHRKGRKGPGAKGVRAFKQALAPSWFLATHLATDFEHEDVQFNELTEQQYDILTFLTVHDRAMISGCAGSGKTMLAVEKARRLADDGKRVLFTCYNKALAQWLEDTYTHDDITFQHFHSLAFAIPKQIGKPIRWISELEGVEEADYWESVVPGALFDAAAALPEGERYDAIIVDEGQDFKSTYWEALQMMLNDPDGGVLYIFYDDSQRLFSDDGFPLPKPAGKLTRNLRSTKEIGEVVARYYEGDGKVVAAGPETGRGVEMVDPAKYGSPADALGEVLGMLQDERVALGDIIVLTPHSQSKSQWSHRGAAGEFELMWSGKIKGKRVQVDTIHGYKGLENPVIILTELDGIEEEDVNTLLYVALSRAKHHVVVLGELPEPVKETEAGKAAEAE